MNIDLPYEIGTVLKTTENGKEQYDRVHHYIVGSDIQVVLVLNYKKEPRFSIPIDIETFKQKWQLCNMK